MLAAWSFWVTLRSPELWAAELKNDILPFFRTSVCHSVWVKQTQFSQPLICCQRNISPVIPLKQLLQRSCTAGKLQSQGRSFIYWEFQASVWTPKAWLRIPLLSKKSAVYSHFWKMKNIWILGFFKLRSDPQRRKGLSSYIFREKYTEAYSLIQNATNSAQWLLVTGNMI